MHLFASHEGTEAVDALRALAIALVVVFHTSIFARYVPAFSLPSQIGYLGVDIFFVISGFCMAFPYLRARSNVAERLNANAFWGKRMARIMPSYLLALAAAVLASGQLAPATLLPTITQHLLFINNGWNDTLGSVNSSFWTLAIEGQFYLLFPLAIVAFLKRPFEATCAAVGIGLWYRLVHVDCCLQIETVIRQLPAYADDFALGIAAAFVNVWILRREISPAWRRAATYAALACCAVLAGTLLNAAAALSQPGGRELWQVWGRTGLALGVAGVIVTSAAAHQGWRRMLGNPLAAFTATISYNLYLWHTMIEIQVWRRNVTLAPSAVFALEILASIAVASLVTMFFERPIAEWLRRRRDRSAAFRESPSTALRYTRADDRVTTDTFA